MKKLIAVISIVTLLMSLLCVSSFAVTITHNKQVDVHFGNNYYKNVGNAYYMYYHPYEPTNEWCWGSLEVSLSNDMTGYASVHVTGVSGVVVGDYSRTKDSSNWIKTDGAFVKDPCAERVEYYGYRVLNGADLDGLSYILY